MKSFKRGDLVQIKSSSWNRVSIGSIGVVVSECSSAPCYRVLCFGKIYVFPTISLDLLDEDKNAIHIRPEESN